MNEIVAFCSTCHKQILQNESYSVKNKKYYHIDCNKYSNWRC
jgi:hypothetical protein